MSRYLPITIGTVLAATWFAGLLILAPSDTEARPERPGAGIEERNTQRLQRRPALSLSEAADRAVGRFQPWTPPTKDGGWRLVASRTTSNAWLYSVRTGRVYRVLAECPQGNPDGCLIPLPVVYGPHRSHELPSHGDDY